MDVVSIKERVRALEICREHLDGVWKDVSLTELKVEKLSGGMSNFLYTCALTDSTRTLGDEPRIVLLRIYGPTHCDTEVQLEIFNQLAAENLGPALYGTFAEGRLEQYLPSDPLTAADMMDDQVSAVVAKKMAAIHRLDLKCLNKRSNWLLEKYNLYNEFIVSVGQPSFNEDALESTRDLAQRLSDIDFQPEIEYMEKLFKNSTAPFVFSHNDLHQNNIILLHQSDKIRDLQDRIVLIDFEYCSYNYRTFDIANHLSEWCFDYNTDKYPYFRFNVDRFPSEAKQRQILRNYVNQLSDYDDESFNRLGIETNVTDRQDSRDSMVDVLLDEMQPFFMASNLLWTLWAIYSAHTSKIEFGYWEMAQSKWTVYQLCKKRYRNKTPVTGGCEQGDFTVECPKL